MRPGDTHVGPDGTIYLVVRPAAVAEDTPRWWVEWSCARMRVDDYIGPDTIADLHLLPRKAFGDVGFALVLP